MTLLDMFTLNSFVDDETDAFGDAFGDAVDHQAKFAIAYFDEHAQEGVVAAGDEKPLAPTLNTNDMFDEKAWDDAVATSLTPLMTEVVEAAADQAAIAVGLTDVSNPYVIETAEKHISQIDDYSTALKGHVTRQVEVALREGLSIEDTAKRLATGPFDGGRSARAVAQTEVIAAQNGGAMAMYRALGEGSVEVEWLATPDGNTRSSHSEAGDQDWIKPHLDEKFVVSGQTCEYPGDISLDVGERVNCRCRVVPHNIKPEDEDDFSNGPRVEEKEPVMAKETNTAPATGKVDAMSFDHLSEGERTALIDKLTVDSGTPVTNNSITFTTGENGTLETAPKIDLDEKNVVNGDFGVAEFVIEDRADGEPADSDFGWGGPIVFEGVATGDGRFIEKGALDWRKLPNTLMFGKENLGGHYGSVPAGNIARMEPHTDGTIWGYGGYDSGEDGQELKRMIEEKTLRGISVDLSAVEWTYDWEEDLLTITKATIMGATATPFPAFADARMDIVGGDEALAASGALAEPFRFTFTMPVVPTATGWTLGSKTTALVASGGAAVAEDDFAPHPDVFKRKDATWPFRVDADNNISGLITSWEAVHLSFADQEIHPPKSKTDYDMLHTPGTVICSDGSVVSIGRVFGDMDHVSTGSRQPPEDVAAAYANTGQLVAVARFYDTPHGIEVAGTMAPGTTKIDAAKLRACDISPDWRPMASLPFGDNLECVAMLAVNMSGFNLGLAASGEPPRPQTRAAFDTQGHLTAMTGASPLKVDRFGELESRIRDLEEREFARRRASVEDTFSM